MKKRDLIVIGAILALALLASLVIFLSKEPGAGVIVRVSGVEVARYAFTSEGEYPLNGGTNILHIEGGKAWLTDADCPDLLCVRQGKIDETGETITCLPNKLTVTVYGTEAAVDLIS